MDLDKIKSLMSSFEKSDVRELKIDEGNFHLYLSKNGGKPVIPKEVQKADLTEKKSENQPQEKSQPEVIMPLETIAGGTPIKAPVAGKICLQSPKDKTPYVKVGYRVEKEEKIASIDTDGKMVTVKSNVTGIVTAIDVRDQDLVTANQPLMMVREG